MRSLVMTILTTDLMREFECDALDTSAALWRDSVGVTVSDQPDAKEINKTQMRVMAR